MNRPDLDDFIGNWTIKREIRDHLAGHKLGFDGEAVFSTAREGMDYQETGKLIRPGTAAMSATQRYHWRQEGDEIAVFFADDRPFHRISPDAVSSASHDCPPDFYQVAYDFSDFSCWSAEWTVRGPRKDYKMCSYYRRTDL